DADNEAGDVDATLPEVQKRITRASNIWNPQAGVEVTLRSFQIVVDPGGLIELDHAAVGLSTAERRLIGQLPGGPARSAVATDLNVYFGKAIKGGNAGGVSYTNQATPSVIALQGPGMSDSALAHEIGHWILVGWPGNEHNDLNGQPWPDENVMHFEDKNG